MKREAIGHTKMKRLCRRLDIPLWQAVGLLESIWQVTGRECPRGDLGKLSNEDIALAIDYRGDENRMIEALISCGWLEADPIERLIVHDWWEHADDAVNMRLARSKQHFVRGVSPKLSRLSEKERMSCAQFYASCAQNGELCAPPEPRQSPAPPEPAPAPKCECVAVSEFPETAAAVRGYFAGADDAIVVMIATGAVRSYADAVNGHASAHPLTDAIIAEAVHEAHFEKQKSPGLFLEKVPRVVKSWAEEAIRNGSIQ